MPKRCGAGCWRRGCGVASGRGGGTVNGASARSILQRWCRWTEAFTPGWRSAARRATLRARPTTDRTSRTKTRKGTFLTSFDTKTETSLTFLLISSKARVTKVALVRFRLSALKVHFNSKEALGWWRFTMGKPNSTLLLLALVVEAAMMLVSAPRTAAQTVTGTIVGTVLDAQGAVVPNASISAKSRETGLERTAVSNTSGEFTITSVPAGPYDVTVSATGFRPEVRSGITMTVGANLRLDFKLSVGDVQQKVVVTAELPQVDTTSSTLSGLVNDTSIRQLPLNGRDWLQLTALQAGVLVGLTKNPDPGENVTHGAGVFLTVSGGRPTSNVFMVDGLVINDEANKSPGGAVHGVNLGVDAIREFSVLTSTFPAEYGRSSGGVVNAITQSGTNSIHGTALGFLRNSALDAPNYFTGKVPFHRGQFGSAIGGPIKKDKLFYFADSAGIREFKADSAPTFTISDAARNGSVPGQKPFNSNVIRYLAMFPVANRAVVAGDRPYVGRYSLPGGTRGTEDYVIGRIDYAPSTKTTIH